MDSARHPDHTIGETEMKWTLASLAVAMIALPISPTLAAGPFDGTWQVDAPDAGSSSSSDVSSCEAARLQFQVKDNQVQGQLGRSPYGARFTQSGPGTTPITGTVQPDGTLNAQWQKYKATGKLTGDKAELRWKGTCGPRVATGGRVGPTEGAGSTTGTR
jgi:hypothetical protein